MLIESYVVNFSEVKRCISSLQIDDFIVVSENIFALTEAPQPQANDLLSDSTPVNHPEALDRKSTRLNSSHSQQSRMPSSA